jgi:hypothetical protein
MRPPRSCIHDNYRGEFVTAVMNGVRVVEVAEHGFVPAAGASLSDWGPR